MAVACAPQASAPTAPPAKPAATEAAKPAGKWDGQAEWDTLVDAAKREGRLVISVGAGTIYREHALTFQRKYPEIAMEIAAANAAVLMPRVLAERRNGQYLWDVHTGATTVYPLRDEGAFDPLKPALLLPEVLDNANWLDGFDAGFNDTAKQHLYSFEGRLSSTFYVNRDLVSEAELSSVEQLVDPRWRGKIVATDPRRGSAASATAAHLLLIKGEDWVRQFLAQDIVVASDNRQIAEFIARGRYPIALGMSEAELETFQREGVGRNVKPLAPKSELGGRLSTGNGSMALYNRAPNPNAAKLYVNWLLTQEVQARWVEMISENSRRLDVPKKAENAPPPGIFATNVNREENMASVERIWDIARELVK
jgi:iron(III) transport system substrate-binding protein